MLRVCPARKRILVRKAQFPANCSAVYAIMLFSTSARRPAFGAVISKAAQRPFQTCIALNK
ncbi:hypothetical protein RHECNPAF_1340086 [Rhizobium etli CNPAF512]|nr:hypothetical protein RHECNPAF_1340086 [Rhizobium etli CNPAF512]